MIFTKPLWLFGVGMSLESMRRGFIGGSALSLFIIKSFGLEKGAVPTIEYMTNYLAVEERLLENIPYFLNFLILPFTDYHDAGVCYLKILEILSELQRPRTCQFYWQKGESQ